MTKAQFKKHFPKWLKKEREAYPMTQSELAKRTGLTPAWISHFESGRRLPNAYGMFMIEGELGRCHG